MKIFGIPMPSIKDALSTKALKLKWKTLTTFISKWFTDNIFDSGGEGKPMKLFGFELALLKIKLPTGAEILAALPDWMTDPIGALKNLVKALTKYLPSWLGGPKSEKELKAEAARIEKELKAEAARIKDVANKRKMRESLSDAVASKEITKELRTQIMAYRSTRKLFDKKYGGGDQEAFIKFLQDAGKRGFNQRAGFKLTGDIPAAKIKELRILDERFKKAALDGNSLFTHDTGLHERADRIITILNNSTSSIGGNMPRILDEKFKKAALHESKNSSIFTHDTGLHERADRIITILNNSTSSIGGNMPRMMLPKQSVIPGLGGGGGNATVINAPTTSNVTTTGNSGQFPLQNNRYANLNRAYA